MGKKMLKRGKINQVLTLIRKLGTRPEYVLTGRNRENTNIFFYGWKESGNATTWRKNTENIEAIKTGMKMIG